MWGSLLGTIDVSISMSLSSITSSISSLALIFFEDEFVIATTFHNSIDVYVGIVLKNLGFGYWCDYHYLIFHV